MYTNNGVYDKISKAIAALTDANSEVLARRESYLVASVVTRVGENIKKNQMAGRLTLKRLTKKTKELKTSMERGAKSASGRMPEVNEGHKTDMTKRVIEHILGKSNDQ